MRASKSEPPCGGVHFEASARCRHLRRGDPYASSWDLLEVIRTSAALQSQPFVITTPNKQKLEEAVGLTSALEIGGREEDLRRVSKAVEAATDAAPKHM